MAVVYQRYAGIGSIKHVHIYSLRTSEFEILLTVAYSK